MVFGDPQGYVLEVGFIIVSLRLLKNVSLYYFLICKKLNHSRISTLLNRATIS